MRGGGGHAWQGVCMVGGMRGRGAGVCMAMGHAWQGACVAGGMCVVDRGHAWQGDVGGGHAW